MGGICSSDTTPDLPKIIKADPPTQGQMRWLIARLGTFGGSRDFGVWDGNDPESGKQNRDTMWLWLNKSDVGQNGPYRVVRIDVENFVRNNPNVPTKGQVLFFATFIDSIRYQTFQRLNGVGQQCFTGFFGADSGMYQNYNDDYYLGHRNYNRGQEHDRRRYLGNIITKWSMSDMVTVNLLAQSILGACKMAF